MLPIHYCLEEAGISASQINNVVFYEKPFVKFERLIETYLAFAPEDLPAFLAIPIWRKKTFKNQPIKMLKSTLDENINWQVYYYSQSIIIPCIKRLIITF